MTLEPLARVGPEQMTAPVPPTTGVVGHVQPPVALTELLLCQAATAVKRSVGCSIEMSVLKTTLVMWRLRARIASVLVLPSARFFAR
jgi:hypothetical protein